MGKTTALFYITQRLYENCILMLIAVCDAAFSQMGINIRWT